MQKKRVLILGCGQFYCGDDAVGLVVAQRLKEERLPERWEVHLSQAPLDDLLDSVGRYDQIFLIDAIISGQCEPGKLRKLERDRWPGANFRISSGHSLSLPEAVALLEQLNPNSPCTINLLGIEVDPNHLSGPELSEELNSRIPIIIEQLKSEILALSDNPGPSYK